MRRRCRETAWQIIIHNKIEMKFTKKTNNLYRIKLLLLLPFMFFGFYHLLDFCWSRFAEVFRKHFTSFYLIFLIYFQFDVCTFVHRYFSSVPVAHKPTHISRAFYKFSPVFLQKIYRFAPTFQYLLCVLPFNARPLRIHFDALFFLCVLNSTSCF